jgi:hypothetical protein
MKIDKQEVIDYIKKCSKESKIYFGADSERVMVNGQWKVDYLLCIIIHIDSKHGGKVFGQIERDHDYDAKLSRPKLRLMNEVYPISNLYLEFAEEIEDYDVSIHLDLNPMPVHGSSCAVSEAIGYIKGVCGLDPVVKPHAWAASNVADAVRRLTS